jgi:hypothetical protein
VQVARWRVVLLKGLLRSVSCVVVLVFARVMALVVDVESMRCSGSLFLHTQTMKCSAEAWCSSVVSVVMSRAF